jgi:imidazolonepropionase
MTATTLFRDCHLATLCGGDWGFIERAALLAQDGAITWVGPERELPAGLAVADEHALQGALLTPGLIDCHTHLVYGGHRAHEADLRLQGASYEAIARAGGGIRSTVAATRSATEAELLALACARADALMREGVTTVEVKSGYGLTLADEAKCLRVARALGVSRALSVHTTYLGAHALPPEFEGRADDYIRAVCDWMVPLQAQGLVDAVDAFCETIGFSPAQTRRVFDAARALGLPVKLHAEQLSHQGGAELAAGYGALSCDHIEHLSPAGIAAMRAAGTVAVLLPAAWYCLRDTTPPPVAALREAGVPMAVSTDHNPGTSPCLSLLTALHMACTFWRLTPLEALQGATIHAARALGLHDRGTLATGQRADLVAWRLNHPRELAYWLGGQPCAGRAVAGRWLPFPT